MKRILSSCRFGLVPAQPVLGTSVAWSFGTSSFKVKGPLVTMLAGSVHLSWNFWNTSCRSGNVTQMDISVLKSGTTRPSCSTSVLSSVALAPIAEANCACFDASLLLNDSSQPFSSSSPAPKMYWYGLAFVGSHACCRPNTKSFAVTACPSDHLLPALILTV